MQHDDEMTKIGLSSRGAGILAGDLLVHGGGEARGTALDVEELLGTKDFFDEEGG